MYLYHNKFKVYFIMKPHLFLHFENENKKNIDYILK